MTHRPGPPILYGHRGAAGVCPENSYVSFARALADGATALELDVHLSRDGEVVVFHDDDGQRMAKVAAAVEDLDFRQLASWDLGHGFSDASYVGRRLSPPALRDVLRGFPGVRVNIDLKSPDPRLRAATIKLVQDEGAVDRVLLASFSDDTIDAVIADGCACRTNLGKRSIQILRFLPLWLCRRLLRRHVERGGARVQIPPQAGGIRLDDAGFIARCHALGFAVDYWVINDVEQARTLLERGADGLITDFPGRLRHLFPSTLSSSSSSSSSSA
ncbi:MAG TPA: glycerophosphodiester phosphodiesterase family protein, partial [Myxococcota bacterium]